MFRRDMFHFDSGGGGGGGTGGIREIPEDSWWLYREWHGETETWVELAVVHVKDVPVPGGPRLINARYFTSEFFTKLRLDGFPAALQGLTFVSFWELHDSDRLVQIGSPESL